MLKLNKETLLRWCTSQILARYCLHVAAGGSSPEQHPSSAALEAAERLLLAPAEPPHLPAVNKRGAELPPAESERVINEGRAGSDRELKTGSRLLGQLFHHADHQFGT